MPIDCYELGPFGTNCYVIRPEADGEDTGRCWVADCGFDPGVMFDAIEGASLKPEALVLTHAHCDHMAGVRSFLERFPGTPVYIHEAEAAWLGDPEKNLSLQFGFPVTAPKPDHLLSHGQMLELCGERWRVLHTPGHSPGGVALVRDEPHPPVTISGDALFNESIGRTDFPGSSMQTLATSIREHLYALPTDTRVLSGHGPETTIGHEMLHNPFVPAS